MNEKSKQQRCISTNCTIKVFHESIYTLTFCTHLFNAGYVKQVDYNIFIMIRFQGFIKYFDS